jgi:hypothetical protein
MKRSDASGPGAFRRSSPIVWRSGFELLLAAALCAGCASATSGVSSPQSVPFNDHGTTQQSGNDGGPRIAVANDAGPIGLGELARASQVGRLYVGVFAGIQRTGGYSVKVDRIERTGDGIVVHATFSAPAPGALTIQVITSPAQLVSIDQQSASGVRTAVLVDQSGAERARTTVTQSRS